MTPRITPAMRAYAFDVAQRVVAAPPKSYGSTETILAKALLDANDHLTQVVLDLAVVAGHDAAREALKKCGAA